VSFELTASSYSRKYFLNKNGIVQGAEISVMAMIDICKEMEEPTKMIGYADDWIIYTSHKLPKVAKTCEKIDIHPQKKPSPNTKTQD
jgi:hypothetical protein